MAEGCLTEDELLGLASGQLAERPSAEKHLADCPECSALLASVIRDLPAPEVVKPKALTPGSAFGPYRIDAHLGSGGMGSVYRAWDQRLGRAVALKVLHDASAKTTVEARAAGSIDHPAVVRIYDVGEADGISYVAMELVDGESLRSVLAAGAVGLQRAREIFIKLVDGLAAAHARGVVHRDLKPENIVLTREGPRILDFGLAKLVDEETPADATASGTVRGTAGYMAPEQARGSKADARADLFSVGAIAYELITGQRAFPGATTADRLSATLRDDPPLESPGPLQTIVARCLAKDPEGRFQTAKDLSWALMLPTSADRPMSRRALGLGALSALGLGSLGYLLGMRSRVGGASLTTLLGAQVRRLTHRTGRVYSARFMGGGTRVLYGAAWDIDPLQLYEIELASGESNALQLPEGDLLAVSARGEIAESIGHRFIDHQSMRGELALVSLVGGKPRVLDEGIQEADFVPEGAVRELSPSAGDAQKKPAGLLAVIRPVAKGYRIEFPLGTPLVESEGWLTHLRASPDGLNLAYLEHPHSDDDSGDLKVINLATRASRTLSTGWTSVAGIAWDPDGDSIWFTSSKNDLSNTLQRAWMSGRVESIPSPSAPRLRIHDVRADRHALVTVDAWRLRAMVGEHDRSLSEISNVSDITADGAQVLIGELGDLEAGYGAYLVPYAGGRHVRLGPGFPVAVSPSGQRVAANVQEATRLVIYELGSAKAPQMETPGFVTFARWLDETALLALFEKKLWRIGFGSKPVPMTEAAATPFALNPSRQRAAYVDLNGAMRVLDLASGETHAIPGVFPRAEVCGWVGEDIVVRSTTTPIVLERIRGSGERVPLTVIRPPAPGLKAVDTFVLDASGTRYAYSYGEELSQLTLMAL